MNPLSAARIAGEVGLAGGTITGGACAAHYGRQVQMYKANGLKGHHDLRNVMTNSYLVSRYLVDKHTSLDPGVKREVENFMTCLREYIADATDPHCIYKIPEDNSLKQKMQHFGVNFS